MNNFKNLLCKDTIGKQSAVDYLEKNIYLPIEVSPNNAGKLSLARQTWAHAILEEVLNPKTQKITLCFGAQTGKTTILFLAYCLLAKFNPQPTLIALPNDSLADRLVKTRLLPLLKNNEPYKSLLPTNKQSVNRTIKLGAMPTLYTGAKSPASLSSMPAAYLFCDELAKWESGRQSEAHPYLLVQERVKSFPLHKIFLTSTPSIEENVFWEQFLQSDQNYYYMPCPHCKKDMRFELKCVDIKKEVIICPHCGAALNEYNRLAMIKNGHWVPTNTNNIDKSHKGYHLNSLYSPYVSIKDFCDTYRLADQNLLRDQAMRNFYNSWLGLPYSGVVLEEDDNDTLEAARACVGDLHRGTIPEDALFVTLGVDPGQNQTHWVACAICPDRLVVIDYGTIVAYSGEEGVANLFNTLEWNGYRPDICYVDSGYSATEIYKECKKETNGLINPCKGSHGYGSWNKVKVRMSDLQLITYSDYSLKQALYGDHGLIKEQRLVLPYESDFGLIDGLSHQKLIKPKGKQRYSWREVSQDHYGDCIKLCMLSGIVNQETARKR